MSNLSGKRVLLVEDEYFIADEIAAALAGAGSIVVGPFALAAKAERAVRYMAVDAAILNVRVQDGLTYELAKLLRERAIPFVFATGPEAREERPEWQDARWVSRPSTPS